MASASDRHTAPKRPVTSPGLPAAPWHYCNQRDWALWSLVCQLFLSSLTNTLKYPSILLMFFLQTGTAISQHSTVYSEHRFTPSPNKEEKNISYSGHTIYWMSRQRHEIASVLTWQVFPGNLTHKPNVKSGVNAPTWVRQALHTPRPSTCRWRLLPPQPRQL